MKNYLIAGLICLVAALTIGIGPVQRIVNEATNQGTLKGVERCMEYAKSDLISKEAIQRSCVQSFQKQLYLPDLAGGEAGPRTEKDLVRWEGTLENKTGDHVTTWVRVVVIVFDKAGKKTEVSGETPIWIDPMGEAEFRVELPELEPKQLDGFEFCEDDVAEPKACMGWTISEVKGLEL